MGVGGIAHEKYVVLVEGGGEGVGGGGEGGAPELRLEGEGGAGGEGNVGVGGEEAQGCRGYGDCAEEGGVLEVELRVQGVGVVGWGNFVIR